MFIKNETEAILAIGEADKVKAYVKVTPDQPATTFTISKREAYEVAHWQSGMDYGNWIVHNGGTLTIGNRS